MLCFQYFSKNKNFNCPPFCDFQSVLHQAVGGSAEHKKQLVTFVERALGVPDRWVIF